MRCFVSSKPQKTDFLSLPHRAAFAAHEGAKREQERQRHPQGRQARTHEPHPTACSGIATTTSRASTSRLRPVCAALFPGSAFAADGFVWGAEAIWLGSQAPGSAPLIQTQAVQLSRFNPHSKAVPCLQAGNSAQLVTVGQAPALADPLQAAEPGPQRARRRYFLRAAAAAAPGHAPRCPAP